MPVKHIVMWDLRGESAQEKSNAIEFLRSRFEGLRGQIPGLLHLEVGVDSSGVDYACDVVLYSVFDSAESLASYATHPAHMRVRDELVGVLVVVGPVRVRSAEEAAAWVGDAVERGRLEASAEVAEAAELRALRAEISPHFVYNALTTVASFVRSDPDRAHDLLLDFADYTRHGLGHHGDYTTLAQEFGGIEAYLALARAVLGERLRVQVRVAPEVLPVVVPFLVLQPLVENAVQHGVELSGGSGTVQVSGEALGPDCVITIEDDGPGMDPDVARAMLAGTGGGDGLGLVNAVFPAAELEDRAMERARQLAAGPRVALRYMKENLNRAVRADLAECLDLEAVHHLRAFETEDHREAARAFVDKRAPNFRGR